MTTEDRLKRLFAASPEQMEAIDGILESGVPERPVATAGPRLMGMSASAKLLGVSPRDTLWQDDQSRIATKDRSVARQFPAPSLRFGGHCRRPKKSWLSPTDIQSVIRPLNKIGFHIRSSANSWNTKVSNSRNHTRLRPGFRKMCLYDVFVFCSPNFGKFAMSPQKSTQNERNPKNTNQKRP